MQSRPIVTSFLICVVYFLLIGILQMIPAISVSEGKPTMFFPLVIVVLVSMVKGKTLAYSLFNLQDRGRLFINPNVDVYEGQVIGLHSRSNDLAVNPIKGKQLTNVRASGTDEALTLTPPVRHTLEQALEFIEDDELVEVTPQSIRLRKKKLLEHERRRASKS